MENVEAATVSRKAKREHRAYLFFGITIAMELAGGIKQTKKKKETKNETCRWQNEEKVSQKNRL